ncbi:N-acetylmuramoyl-L-alanine amidase [Lacticaseibacillus nasuensis]|uniref:N-acetylmuramoyl-L-alanine amidase n=1 Tax=Lacticaseibacillus nasuensis TaxID=944671 RepID=UPI002AFF08A0|nr:N-acetylmuramoyl-L-alanine amidase [Lacticaseibacillus nasuensis]MCX2455601.1 N-acetylmuramoyl-L-alanine amidase [Lacticaseibacillus nasuensis]
MKPLKIKKWPLLFLIAGAIAVSAVTTTVLANNTTLTVRASVLNVRLGPGLAYNVMGRVNNGTQLTVISKSNSWYQVRLAGNKIGWVASWLVDQNEPSTSSAKVATVTQAANVRASASTTAKILGRLSVGDAVNVVYTEGPWSQIAYHNTAAWVASRLIRDTGRTTTLSTPTQRAKTATTDRATTTASTATSVTTTTAANIRQAAGLNARVLTRVPKNTKLAVIKQSGEWYQVKTSTGKTGYVAGWVVSVPGATSGKVATSLGEATIVLDPGHGGSDAGALSTSGKYEKTYTLLMAKAVGAALSAQGANVVYTRDTDSFVDLEPRAATSRKLKADVFISFHFDSSPKANSATGFTSYYYSSGKSKTLASYLDRGFTNLNLTNRGIAFGNYQVLRDNSQPSVLLEMGYINTDKDFKEISSATYRQQVATDVTQSLTSYFKAGNHQ